MTGTTAGLALDPRHGVDGWDLTTYSWDKVTGRAHFLYERNDDNHQVEVTSVQARWASPQQGSNRVQARRR